MDGQPFQPKKHERVYQACEPCRVKKVKCNVGMVDSPRGPPCARCERESKHCYFTETRRRVGTGTDSTAFVKRNRRRSMNPRSSPPTIISVQSIAPTESPQNQPSDYQESLMSTANHTDSATVDFLQIAGLANDEGQIPASQPATASSAASRTLSIQRVSSNLDLESVLEVWQQVRFVQEGLFSAQEAVFYVQYFFEHLEPFTPILSQHFGDLKSHKELVEQEPVLALTILMLASRYGGPSGSAGSFRCGMIHDRLWTEFQSTISKIFWAHDHVPQSITTNNTDCLRTTGTCEAMLLIVEWHPRSLHFPPGGSEHILLRSRHRPTPLHDPSSWQEWCWRSGRLCWSLIGLTLGLAYELGIFERHHASCNNVVDDRRKRRLHTHISTFLLQISARTGFGHAYPEPLFPNGSSEPDVKPNLWATLAELTKRGKDLLYASKEHTKEIIRNGKYVGVLYTLQASLEEWNVEFRSKQNSLTKQMRAMLEIEFNYHRVYFHSLAIDIISMNRLGNASRSHRSNVDFVEEATDGARNVLLSVINNIVPEGRLRFIPVRVYFRILVASLTLLKLCAMNLKSQQDAESCLNIVSQVGNAFQSCFVDENHFSSRWGAALARLAAYRELSASKNGNPPQDRPVAKSQTTGERSLDEPSFYTLDFNDVGFDPMELYNMSPSDLDGSFINLFAESEELDGWNSDMGL